MFVTAVCVLFLIKLRWPKKKSIYDFVNFTIIITAWQLNLYLIFYSCKQRYRVSSSFQYSVLYTADSVTTSFNIS